MADSKKCLHRRKRLWANMTLLLRCIIARSRVPVLSRMHAAMENRTTTRNHAACRRKTLFHPMQVRNKIISGTWRPPKKTQRACRGAATPTSRCRYQGWLRFRKVQKKNPSCPRADILHSANRENTSYAYGKGFGFSSSR